MALALWADEFSVLPSGLLEAGITFDVDFLGTRKEAETTANQLAGLMPGRVEILLPDIDRQTANSAKILLQTFHDRTTALEIDYVSGLFGFTPEAEQRLRMRAFSVETSRGSVKVMHPIDCLISRVMNLDGLPSKQNPAGVAQCRLAVTVTRAFIHRACGDPSRQVMKTALKAAEVVAELSQCLRQREESPTSTASTCSKQFLPMRFVRNSSNCSAGRRSSKPSPKASRN
ncbi:MAG: hypothetical protein IPO95_09660 [Rhodanobacteraceae bacterium]|nr:hypothetical protein [Rhodanobacteraceae bacterium]